MTTPSIESLSSKNQDKREQLEAEDAEKRAAAKKAGGYLSDPKDPNGMRPIVPVPTDS